MPQVTEYVPSGEQGWRPGLFTVALPDPRTSALRMVSEHSVRSTSGPVHGSSFFLLTPPASACRLAKARLRPHCLCFSSG